MSEHDDLFIEDTDASVSDQQLRHLLNRVLSEPEIKAIGAEQLLLQLRPSKGVVLELGGQPLKELMRRAQTFVQKGDLSGAWRVIAPFALGPISYDRIETLQADDLRVFSGQGVSGDAVMADSLPGDSVEQDDGPPTRRA